MKRWKAIGVASLFAATTLLGGCLSNDDSNSGTDEGEDEVAITESMDEEIAGYASPDVFLYGEDAEDSGAGRGAIPTRRWWRELVDLVRNYEIHITRPSKNLAVAEVHVTGVATGILHIVAAEDSGRAETLKNFVNEGSRSMTFERRGSERANWRRGWKLTALSGVLLASPGTTRHINSVHIVGNGLDRTITNVTDLVAVKELLRLPPNSEVVVTVDTGDATDLVALHLRHAHRRFLLDNNGDGTFTGKYLTGHGSGPRHAVVDVLSNGTIFDDAAPYDNMAWGIAYVLRGEDDGVSGRE